MDLVLIIAVAALSLICGYLALDLRRVVRHNRELRRLYDAHIEYTDTRLRERAHRDEKGPAPLRVVTTPDDPCMVTTMDQAVENGAELFAQARAADARRKEIACVVCHEPTMIVCPDCSQHVCMAHHAGNNHVCDVTEA